MHKLQNSVLYERSMCVTVDNIASSSYKGEARPYIIYGVHKGQGYTQTAPSLA